jgi:protein phosphatase 4 regulatory subunit 3
VAIRFFRHLVNHASDEFYVRLVAEKQVLGPILDVLLRTLPRDNLLSSACLDIFEYIRKENIKDLVKHVVENYREKITELGYLEIFHDLIRLYEQSRGFVGNMDTYFMESEDGVGRRPPHVNGRMMEHISVDPMEEEYWNASDDEEENQSKVAARGSMTAGAGPGPGPLSALVDYHSDEESDENGGDAATAKTDSEGKKEGKEAKEGKETKETKEPKGAKKGKGAKGAKEAKDGKSSEEPLTPKSADSPSPSLSSTPPERISEKRRREEEDDDELGKMMQQHKRRNSTSAVRNASGAAAALSKKKSFGGASNSGPGGPKKMSINLPVTLQSSVGQASRGQDDTS